MRNFDYRYIIIGCILLITIPIGIKLSYNPLKIENPAITINKKKISKIELDKRLSEQSYNQDIQSLVNSIVVKELLIQSAIKSGIHKDKLFQKSIQNFYEQSLIKLLLDKQYSELKPTVKPSYVSRYVELSDKIIHLTITTYKNLDDIKYNKNLTQQSASMPFNSLSLFLRYTLLSLNEGENSKPVFSEAGTEIPSEHFTVFKLEKIEQAGDSIEPETDIEMINGLLLEQSKETLISNWIDGLKKKANVSLSPALINDK